MSRWLEKYGARDADGNVAALMLRKKRPLSGLEQRNLVLEHELSLLREKLKQKGYKEACIEYVWNGGGPTYNKVFIDKFKESQAYVEVAEKDRADALKQLDSNEQVIETLRNEIAELKNQIKEYAVEKQKMNDDFTRKLVEQAKELAVLQEKFKSIVIEPVKMSKTK